MRSVTTAAILVAAVSAAAAVVWRLRRRDRIELALGRDLQPPQPGMPLAEVTAHLRRLGVDFTSDSAADGTTLVRFGREVARDGTVTEQQIVFDARDRLLGLRSHAQIRGR
jgi:hypothetical protein